LPLPPLLLLLQMRRRRRLLLKHRLQNEVQAGRRPLPLLLQVQESRPLPNRLTTMMMTPTTTTAL
jgi:hypothetical protein